MSNSSIDLPQVIRPVSRVSVMVTLTGALLLVVAYAFTLALEVLGNLIYEPMLAIIFIAFMLILLAGFVGSVISIFEDCKYSLGVTWVVWHDRVIEYTNFFGSRTERTLYFRDLTAVEVRYRWGQTKRDSGDIELVTSSGVSRDSWYLDDIPKFGLWKAFFEQIVEDNKLLEPTMNSDNRNG